MRAMDPLDALNSDDCKDKNKKQNTNADYWKNHKAKEDWRDCKTEKEKNDYIRKNGRW